jgi:septal ring factor EnvC (AmiA/AmiB activator)
MVLQPPINENINPNPAERQQELERLQRLDEHLRGEVTRRTAELIRLQRSTEKAKRATLAREAEWKKHEDHNGGKGGGPAGAGLGSVV